MGARSALAGRRDDAVEPGARRGGDKHHRAGGRAGRGLVEEACEACAALGVGRGGRAREHFEGLGGILREGVVAVGAEHPLAAERARVDGHAGGPGGGLVPVTRDDVGDGLPDGGDGPFGRAHDELAGARVHLPQHELDRVALGVVAQVDALSLRGAAGVRQRITARERPHDVNLPQVAHARKEAHPAGLCETKRHAREAEGVAHLQASGDGLVQPAVRRGELLVEPSAQGHDRHARGGRLPAPRELHHRHVPERRQREARAQGVAALGLEGRPLGQSTEPPPQREGRDGGHEQRDDPKAEAHGADDEEHEVDVAQAVPQEGHGGEPQHEEPEGREGEEVAGAADKAPETREEGAKAGAGAEARGVHASGDLSARCEQHTPRPGHNPTGVHVIPRDSRAGEKFGRGMRRGVGGAHRAQPWGRRAGGTKAGGATTGWGTVSGSKQRTRRNTVGSSMSRPPSLLRA